MVSRFYQSIPQAKKTKHGTIIQLAYINDDATIVDVIRVFPNTEALDLQLQGADERTKAIYQFIEPTSIEIYGTPNNYALEMMKNRSNIPN